MHVYCGNNLSEAIPPAIPSQYFYGNIFAEKVEGSLGWVGVSPPSCHNNKLTQLKFTFIREDVFNSGAGNSSANLLTANMLLRGGGEKKKNRIEERWMCLGDTCDQILGNFGAPNKVFYKSDDKMRIHTPSGESVTGPLNSLHLLINKWF